MQRLGAYRGGAIAAVAMMASLCPVAAQVPVQGLPVSQTVGTQPPPRPQPPKQPPLPSLPVTRLDDRARADLDGPATLTMAFPRPQPVQDVLKVLVADTPFSVVVDPDVTGTFSGELKDVTMRQALEAVLFPLNLDYEVKDFVIRVFVRRHHTRLFAVDVLNVRRSAQRGIRSAVSLQGDPAAVELTSTAGADAFEDITRGVQALLSAGGRMNVDRAAGVVQVTDYEDRLDQIGVYLETVQLRALRQVRLEAHVLEVTMKDAARATIDWAAVRTDAAVRFGAATAGMRVQNAKALIDAVARQGSVRTIAAPQVLAMNNEPAVIRFGTQEVSFDVPSAPRGGDRDRTDPVPAATGLFAGLTLTLTAQIGTDGIVQLSVSPTYSEKSGQIKSPSGGPVPILTISEADTIVRVQEGETVVIAGLLQDRTRVTRSPGVAGVFGGQTRETVKSELVILLTPTVVLPGLLSSAAAGGSR
jgi:MSHA biogenesis protein MshL